MRLISRHILKSLVAPFIWGVVALTGMLLLQYLPPLIEHFGGKGLPASVMVEGVLLMLPALLVETLPMGVLVSVLYGYSQLAANLELVAMYANGISVWRMARPALVGAAFVAAANFILIDQVFPKSNIRFNNLRRDAMAKSPTLALRQQVLNVLPPPAQYILRANQIDPATGDMKHITIFDLSGAEGHRVIVADSGRMAESADGEDLILTLRDGQLYEYKRDDPGRLQQTNFDRDKVIVRGVQNEFERTDSHINPDEREKSSCELLDGVDEQQWLANYYRRMGEYSTRRDLRRLTGLPPILQPPIEQKPTFPPHCGIYRRFGAWIRHIMLPAPAAAQLPPMSFAAESRRARADTTKSGEFETPAPSSVVQQQPATAGQTRQQQPPPKPTGSQQPVTPRSPVPVAPGTAVPGPTTPSLAQSGQQHFLVPPTELAPNENVNQVLFNEVGRKTAVTTIRKYQVEYYQKFALPLASFCFVLIGMALALKFPASGIGLVIGGSLVIFLGFYIMLQGGKNIAIAGRVDPAVALLSPLILFTVVGLVAVNAANREMGTARGQGILDSMLGWFHRRSDAS